jgi:predicted nucleotidyltransferase
MRETGMNEDDLRKVLDELVRRIVDAVHPRRIILFGSAARGQMGPESDLDILVEMPDGTHRRRTTQELYRALFRLGMATDVVVVTQSDVRQFADEPSLVICPALREGRELYHAAA